MNRLLGDRLLYLWEVGVGQHPLDRALTTLAVACPDMDYASLYNLSIGQRDAWLLSVQEQSFGSRLASVATCPHCMAETELTFTVADVRVMPVSALMDPTRRIEVDGYTLDFRLPHSRDLAAITACRDVAAARSLLLQRCVVALADEAGAVTLEAVPEAVGAAVAEAMNMADPQADIRLDLLCPACSYRWALVFDIASYLWTEISAAAKRLLREVHTLARAYGWREQDILAMSAPRRQFYLDMVT